MANTPQAKKRIRRNSARTLINKNRVSRIRTLVKKVENAVAAGDKAAATAARAARNGARRCQGRPPQEHGCAQIFAPDQERERDRLIRARRTVPKGHKKGPAGQAPAGPFLLQRDGKAVAAR